MGRMEWSEGGGKWDNCNSIINKYIKKNCSCYINNDWPCLLMTISSSPFPTLAPRLQRPALTLSQEKKLRFNLHYNTICKDTSDYNENILHCVNRIINTLE